MKSIFHSSFVFLTPIPDTSPEDFYKTGYDYNLWLFHSEPHEAFRIYPDNYTYQFKLIPVDVRTDIRINDLNYSLINY